METFEKETLAMLNSKIVIPTVLVNDIIVWCHEIYIILELHVPTKQLVHISITLVWKNMSTYILKMPYLC